MLFINSFKVLFTFPLFIRAFNSLDILEMYAAFSKAFKQPL